jgi:uncharacterized membrane protein
MHDSLSDPEAPPTDKERTLAALIWPLTAAFGIVPWGALLWIGRDSAFVRFHAGQSILQVLALVGSAMVALAMMLVGLGAALALGGTEIFNQATPPWPVLVGQLGALFPCLVYVLQIAFSLRRAVQANRGEREGYPLVGRMMPAP